MQIYLAVTAEDYPKAQGPNRRFAYAAYRIGPQSALLRQNLPLQTRGGLLDASDREAPPIENPEALCAAFLRECARRGCAGAVLDFEEPPTEDRRAFAALLDRRMREAGRTLYVPQSYGECAPGAVLLVNTAVSGGNFREYLEEEIRRRGGGARTALDVQRLRMDFRLPAPGGSGTPLDAEAFEKLREGKSVFFSPDLCARYFTDVRQMGARDGRAQGGEAHFILFDDADTLNQKLKIGLDLGVGAAFFQWPEIADLIPLLRWDSPPTAPARTPASGG